MSNISTNWLVKLAPGSKVLDLGTGDGKWVNALVSKLRDVQVVGVDASPYLFPSSYPSNVRFVSAVPTRLPTAWTNQFDVVNQHLLTHAPHLSVPTIMPSEWPYVLAEIFRVLKPAGVALFSDDIIGLTRHSESDSEESDSEVETTGSSRRSIGWSIPQSRLRALIEDAGFINIRVMTKGTPEGNITIIAHKA